MTRIFRTALLLAIGIAPEARAQSSAGTAVLRVRARLCPRDGADAAPTEHIGMLAGRDSMTLFLDGPQGLERLPLDRVMSLDASVSAENDYRILGALAGIPVGVAVAIALDSRREAERVIVDVPAGVAAGAVAGFKVGALFSETGAWRSLPIPVPHGTACSRVIENPGA